MLKLKNAKHDKIYFKNDIILQCTYEPYTTILITFNLTKQIIFYPKILS